MARTASKATTATTVCVSEGDSGDGRDLLAGDDAGGLNTAAGDDVVDGNGTGPKLVDGGPGR